MENKQRSIDYDGLDGILQIPDISVAEPKWYRSRWPYTLTAAALIGAFLLLELKQAHLPQSLALQSDHTTPSPPPTQSPAPASDNTAAENPPQNLAGPQTAAPPATQEPPVLAENSSAQQAEPPPNIAGEVSAASPSAVLFTVHFKFDSSRLRLLGNSEKAALIQAAKTCSNIIKLTGHTCNYGPAEINRQIGLARANSVKNLLSANGIPDGQIIVASDGMDNPVEANDTPAGAAKNRRVELICLDQ
ncbi:OmpA family protein [Methylomonas sp. SURF-2]|uniref:OmpA family protein n=1 Tax=Methylomonas subterranea TaxID=2952225 RepID=A0ABT1TKF1_9GAMM|nr:OmpA family protein [Methylomonas sp. SURF-2]MCQ8105557.1 OmpA family protein [Methylomonas sp. SURF-2]